MKKRYVEREIFSLLTFSLLDFRNLIAYGANMAIGLRLQEGYHFGKLSTD